MRYLSLFSGIEAATVAWKPLGWECVGVAEIEPFPCAVLKHHYPTVPNLGDVTKITEDQVKALGRIDLVVGGFPCQDLSVAGQRKGLRNADGTATRSGLFFDAMRIVEWATPRWVVVENVPGLFSSNAGRDFAVVAGALAGTELDVPEDGWGNIGVAAGPCGLVEWSVLDAQWWGLAQRRKRVFLVRDSGDWQRRPPLLFDAACLCGHPPPSRASGKGTAGTLASRTGSGGLGTDFDCDGGVVPSLTGSGRGVQRVGESRGQDPVVVAATLDAAYAKKWGLDNQHVDAGCPNFVIRPIFATDGQANAAFAEDVALTLNSTNEQPYIAHALRAEGFDASEDGTGRGTPLVPVAFTCKDDGRDVSDDVSPTLRKMGHDKSHPNAGGQVAVAYQCQGTNVGEMGTLRSGNGHLTGGVPFVFDTTQITSPEYRSSNQPGAPCHTLAKGQHAPAIAHRFGVRRLLPVECCRLQGFPDHYLDITYRKKPAADGPKYAALGNSMAVPCMRWIGERIAFVDTIPAS